jgi:hypothetical protein
MNMPAELKQAVSQGLPVELTDGTNRYMVIPAEMYERLIATLDFGEHTEAERRAQLQAMGRAAGWEEPEAAVFDNLEPQ